MRPLLTVFNQQLTIEIIFEMLIIVSLLSKKRPDFSSLEYQPTSKASEEGSVSYGY